MQNTSRFKSDVMSFGGNLIIRQYLFLINLIF